MAQSAPPPNTIKELVTPNMIRVNKVVQPDGASVNVLQAQDGELQGLTDNVWEREFIK